ncbi:hypothetical protein MNEG_6678, partial [Monoraphidium neglectum]
MPGVAWRRWRLLIVAAGLVLLIGACAAAAAGVDTPVKAALEPAAAAAAEDVSVEGDLGPRFAVYNQ